MKRAAGVVLVLCLLSALTPGYWPVWFVVGVAVDGLILLGPDRV